MSNAKLKNLDEIAKLKINLAKVAKKCCVHDCTNIGFWHNYQQKFYLANGMCRKHYARFKKSGDATRVSRISGESRSLNPLYKIYIGIKTRCYNKKCKMYVYYGGRGIKMSDEWLNDFTQFERDMGKRPSKKHSVERRDNDLGYSKENCFWANKHQQTANQRSNNNEIGVHFCKSKNIFISYLTVDATKKLRKQFKTEAEAIAQRKAWEIEFKIYDN